MVRKPPDRGSMVRKLPGRSRAKLPRRLLIPGQKTDRNRHRILPEKKDLQPFSTDSRKKSWSQRNRKQTLTLRGRTTRG